MAGRARMSTEGASAEMLLGRQVTRGDRRTVLCVAGVITVGDKRVPGRSFDGESNGRVIKF